MDCLCWKTGTTKGGHANRHVWKFDLSIDDSGLGKIEKISYDAYNESTADQIYRTRDNRKFCKFHGIRLSGPKLGRPSLTKQSVKEKR